MSNETETLPDWIIVGQLHYPGDVRTMDIMVYSTARYGHVIPFIAEYDMETDRTTVQFAGLPQ